MEIIKQVTIDKKYAKNAYDAFIELNNKFPKSKYSKKSKKHIILLNNQLAGKEMSIGKFYQTKGNFLSGILRYKYVLKNYKKSAQIPESLYRLVECYLSLGLKNQAIRYTKVLGFNFPKTQWDIDAQILMKKHSVSLTENYEKEKSLNLDTIDPNEFNSF